MTELELRALVRDAIARHAGGSASAFANASADKSSHPRTVAPSHLAPSHLAPSHLAPSHHSSHLLFMLPTGSDADGPCIIEPAVNCNHCGYCKSYGH
jgi:hypothetical protein